MRTYSVTKTVSNLSHGCTFVCWLRVLVKEAYFCARLLVWVWLRRRSVAIHVGVFLLAIR